MTARRGGRVKFPLFAQLGRLTDAELDRLSALLGRELVGAERRERLALWRRVVVPADQVYELRGRVLHVFSDGEAREVWHHAAPAHIH